MSLDLLEGPFRPTLTPEAFSQILSKGGKAFHDKSHVESKDLIIPGIEQKLYMWHFYFIIYIFEKW